jgi:hypothetical protein
MRDIFNKLADRKALVLFKRLEKEVGFFSYKYSGNVLTSVLMGNNYILSSRMFLPHNLTLLPSVSGKERNLNDFLSQNYSQFRVESLIEPLIGYTTKKNHYRSLTFRDSEILCAHIEKVNSDKILEGLFREHSISKETPISFLERYIIQ